jgi:hypothetical protein
MAPAFPLAGHRLPWPPQTALPRAAARALLQLLPAGGWPPVPGATNCQAGPAACCRSLTAHRSQRSQSGCSPASTSTNVDGVLCRTASLMHLLLRARPAEEQQLGVRQVDCQPPPLAARLQACCCRGPAPPCHLHTVGVAPGCCCPAAMAGRAAAANGLPEPTCLPASPKEPPLLLLLLPMPAVVARAAGRAASAAAGCCSCRPASRLSPVAAATAVDATGTCICRFPLPLPLLETGPTAVAANQSLAGGCAGPIAAAPLPPPLPPRAPPAVPLAPAPPAPPPPLLPSALFFSMVLRRSLTVLRAVANCWELRVGATSSGARAGSTSSAARRAPHCLPRDPPSASTHMAVGADLSTAVTCSRQAEAEAK